MSTVSPPDPAGSRPTPLVPLDRPGRVPTALPLPLTSFVGREREVAAVVAALRRDVRHDTQGVPGAPGTRLLTLTGPGGVGKTRLALRVAEELVGDPSASSELAVPRNRGIEGRRQAYPDGVWFVPLAPVQDPALVAATVAATLGVREAGGRPLVAALQAFLRDKQALLILDNFEHVLEAAPLVTDLLGACPRLAVLATSRAVLRLSGEHDFAVPPLSLDSEAVRLFVERARAARDDFALTAGNAAAVAAICHRLDGLPLAIELAAAQSRIFAPEALLARLEPRLPLLTGGPRDQPARLQTMRDAIAWSHDLLSSDEQALFRRLAVFVGGFSLDAAERVAGDGSAPVTLDLFASLVDKSLVRREEGPAGEARFGMLETIREYGLEQLAASGEEETIRAAHAAHVLTLAERADAALSGPEQQVWLDRLEAEHGNLRLALEWCLTNDAEAGLRLAGALSLFWQVRGYLVEGRRWLEALLARAPAGTAARAKALHTAGQLARHQADVARGASLCEESLAIFRALGDTLGEASVLRTLGLLVWDGGDLRRGRALFEESLTLSRQEDDDLGVARTLGTLGCLALIGADYGRAKACLEESLALAQRMGDRRGAAVELGNLGHLAWDEGDDARAEQLFEENLALSRDIGNKRERAYTVAWLGNLARSQGDEARARAFLTESLKLHGQIGDKLGIAYCLCCRGVLAVHQGDHALGIRLISAASSLHQPLEAQLTPRERRDRDRAWATAQTALGTEAVARARADGRALTPEQAIVAALAETADPPDAWAASAPGDAAERAGLSPRELEVLRLLVDGQSDKEIASSLFISRRTASKHVESIRAKLGLPSRAAVVAHAVRHRLV